jgi:hypothetical protein
MALDYESPSKKERKELPLGHKVFIGEIIIWGTLIALGILLFVVFAMWDWLTK